MRQLNKHQFLFPLPLSLLSSYSGSPRPAAICAPIPGPPVYIVNPLLLSSPLAHRPPLLCDSRQGFNFSMLIVSLPTLCMSNTYWLSRDGQYTP